MEQPIYKKNTFTMLFSKIKVSLICKPRNMYLFIGNGRKGPISWMSDECLMKGKSCTPYFGEY